jgi:hypothetical protein
VDATSATWLQCDIHRLILKGDHIGYFGTDIENELVEMNPFDRLSAIEEMMQRAVAAKLPEESLRGQAEDGMDATSVTFVDFFS